MSGRRLIEFDVDIHACCAHECGNAEIFGVGCAQRTDHVVGECVAPCHAFQRSTLVVGVLLGQILGEREKVLIVEFFRARKLDDVGAVAADELGEEPLCITTGGNGRLNDFDLDALFCFHFFILNDGIRITFAETVFELPVCESQPFGAAGEETSALHAVADDHDCGNHEEDQEADESDLVHDALESGFFHVTSLLSLS